MHEPARLFSIETNRDFLREPAVLSASHERLARYFDLGAPRRLFRISKPNHRSELQVADCDAGVFVLRRSGEDAEGLEQRCRLLSHLDGAVAIRPRAGAAGYVLAEASARWICYPWIAGDVWDGQHPSFANVLSTTACFLRLLSAAGRDNSSDTDRLPRQNFKRDLWAPALEHCLGSPATLEPTLSASCSAATRHFLSRKGGQIRRLLDRVLSLPSLDADTIVHADLNHANLVVSPDGSVCVVDIEDIVRGDPRVAAAHAAFKQLRHAIYAGATTATEARSWVAASLVDCLAGGDTSAAPVLGRPEDAFLYGALTVFEDIYNAVQDLLERRETWRFYDFEKRVHNLFEMGILFSATPDAWMIET